MGSGDFLFRWVLPSRKRANLAQLETGFPSPRTRSEMLRYATLSLYSGALSTLLLLGACSDSRSDPTLPILPASIQLSADRGTLFVGETVTLTALVSDQTGRPVLDPQITWTSSDANRASVSPTGQVLALAPGPVILTARVESASGDMQLVILPSPVHSLALADVPDSILIGQSATLRATARSADGTTLFDRPIGWETDDPAVATIDSFGTLTGVGAGVVEITASSEGISAKAVVRISRPPSPLDGQVLGDLRLTRDGSPYALSRLEIGPDARLIVDPGVVIRGTAQNQVGNIDVWGTIELKGTEDLPIVLDAVVLSTRGGSFNEVGKSRVFLEHVEMIGGGVRRQTFYGGQLTIERSTFNGAFIEFENPGEGSALRSSVLKGSPVKVRTGPGTVLLIENNLFTSSSTLTHPIFDNSEAIQVSGGSVLARYNSFLGFSGVAVRLSNHGRLDARSNFWGTTDPIAIRSMLFDRGQSLSVENFIDWEPFLAAPHPSTPTIE